MVGLVNDAFIDDRGDAVIVGQDEVGAVVQKAKAKEGGEVEVREKGGGDRGLKKELKGLLGGEGERGESAGVG